MNTNERIDKEAEIALNISQKLTGLFRQEIKKYHSELGGKVSDTFLLAITGGFLTLLLTGYTNDHCEIFFDCLKQTFMLWKIKQKDEKQ